VAGSRASSAQNLEPVRDRPAASTARTRSLRSKVVPGSSERNLTVTLRFKPVLSARAPLQLDLAEVDGSPGTRGL
jgi:hypothetical protein